MPVGLKIATITDGKPVPRIQACLKWAPLNHYNYQQSKYFSDKEYDAVQLGLYHNTVLINVFSFMIVGF